jgi:DNA-binding SARP family transcriptional activator/tetratricopeptide (TPR) repeat protein
VELRLLGPVELWAADRVWEVGPPQRRHVLAALAVDAGRPVSTETLIDRVWDEAPPGARRALQVHITNLRRLLERTAPGSALSRRSGGYVLEVDPARIDVHRFRTLEQAGRSRRDATLLRQARSLWRGEALAGLTGDWAVRTRQTWQRWYVDATVAWAEAELAASNPGEAVGPLRELAGEYPLSEPLAAMLLRALRAAGRPAEALEHYAALRDHLAAELGTDPGPELQAVHRTILRGEPGPPTGVPAPAQLPTDVPGFAGRQEYLARLDQLAGNGTVVISALSGMAGVGKTALAVHWARRVADRFPGGQLYVNLRGFAPTGRVVEPADAVRGFLDALGVPPDQIPVGADAQAARYRALLADRRMLVVLDNARDAEQVRPLLPGDPTSLALITSRNQLTGLIATDGAVPLDLDVLSPGEAHELLTRRLGNDRVAAEPDAARQIVTACGRLPLALSIVAARARQTGFPLASLAAELTEAGHRLTALDGGDPLTDVRAVFSWSHDALTPPAARLFRLLSLHPGPDLSIAAAAALAGTSRAGTRRLLTELTRASLATEHLPGRYTRHDLLHAYATELASADDHSDALIRLIAHYTHTACAANRIIYPTLEPMILPLEPLPDGAAPDRLADHRAAMAWLETEHANLLAIFEPAVRKGLDSQVWQLAWGLDTFHYRHSHWHDKKITWQAGVAASERLGNLTAHAYAHRRLGDAYRRLNQSADAQVHAEEALRLFTSSDDLFGQASALLDLDLLAAQEGDLDRSLDLARRALALARTVGHERQQSFALNSIGWILTLQGRPAAALEPLHEALAFRLEGDDRESVAYTRDSIGFAYSQLGDHAEAVDHYERALAIFRELGYAMMEANVLVHLGDAHHAAGHLGAAHDVWSRALKLYTELDRQQAVNEVREKLRPPGSAEVADHPVVGGHDPLGLLEVGDADTGQEQGRHQV